MGLFFTLMIPRLRPKVANKCSRTSTHLGLWVTLYITLHLKNLCENLCEVLIFDSCALHNERPEKAFQSPDHISTSTQGMLVDLSHSRKGTSKVMDSQSKYLRPLD